VTHEAEYHDNMVTMLELIWGEGYMAPGGPGNVSRMLDGTEPAGKRILDIGCGIGGPAMEMARAHGAEVTGIDLEAPLIARATASASRAGLGDRCRFIEVAPGPLAFEDQSFDIVVSSGAVTQTDDKSSMFAEILRVLRPGGWFSCYEWMGDGSAYSDDMHYWIKVEELTYDFRTLSDYSQLLVSSGFSDVDVSDVSDWYRAEARREYELISGDLYPSMVELLGQHDADHFVEDWRAMVIVIDSGEMRQGYCRGRRPV
jgi:ubiquinone/menaquinone biosynthesis C-methylase UbiE